MMFRIYVKLLKKARDLLRKEHDMERPSTKSRGFTLIELMIVVAILAVLAAVAIVAYGAYVERSRNSEATAMLADVRIKQESYRATFHQYANPSGNTTTWLPDADPTDQARYWSDGDADAIARWNQLGIKGGDNQLFFSYVCVSGTPGEAPDDPFSGMGIEDTNDFWYAARAMQDVDGNGDCGGFEIYTGKMQVVDLEEGTEPCP
jgi:type IV pilus assembly protein PilA